MDTYFLDCPNCTMIYVDCKDGIPIVRSVSLSSRNIVAACF